MTIDHSVMKRGKAYAKATGTSLSDIIENYLKAITHAQNKPDTDIGPIVKSMKGSFKAPKDFDYKKALASRLQRSSIRTK